MKRIVIITNIPSPYRVDLFHYLQTYVKEYEFYVLYTKRDTDTRMWKIRDELLINTVILNSKVIKMKQDLDWHHIYIPAGVSRRLSEIKPEVVIAFEYNLAAMQALFWCRVNRKKYISLTDGTKYSERNIGYLQKLSRKIISRLANAFIASSTKAKEKLMEWGIPEDRIFISLLTVDIEPFKKVKRNPKSGLLLYVGSMVKRKGLDLLINALPYITCDYELRIVGNGSDIEKNMLQRLAEEKGVSGKITWVGFREGDDLIEEYGKAQVFVLPTREDCFALVLLEAMCAGLPIVSSQYADGAYEIVEEGINGYIADPYDEVEFARTIEKVLTSNKIKASALKASCEKFTFENVSLGYLAAIESVL